MVAVADLCEDTPVWSTLLHKLHGTVDQRQQWLLLLTRMRAALPSLLACQDLAVLAGVLS